MKEANKISAIPRLATGGSLPATSYFQISPFCFLSINLVLEGTFLNFVVLHPKVQFLPSKGIPD